MKEALANMYVNHQSTTGFLIITIENYKTAVAQRACINTSRKEQFVFNVSSKRERLLHFCIVLIKRQVQIGCLFASVWRLFKSVACQLIQ